MYLLSSIKLIRKINFWKIKSLTTAILIMLMADIFYSVGSAYVPPSSVNTDKYYFGSRIFNCYSDYFRLVAPASTVFNDYLTPYQFTKPFGKSYTNITTHNIIFSSFQSDAVDYFGFDVDHLISGNPATSVNIYLTVVQNSAFKIMGFSVIVICQSFKQIMYLIEYNLDVQLQWYPKPHLIPTNRDQQQFIKSFTIKTSSSQSFFTVLLPCQVDIANNYISMRFNSHPDDDSMTNDVKVKAIVILIDIGKILLKEEFSFFSYTTVQNDYHNLCCGTVNFGISPIYGTDYNKHCILGFPFINYISRNKGVFDYQLDPNVGVINGRDNSLPINAGLLHSAFYQYLCTLDNKCPTTHPFKLKNNPNCFDCVDGNIVSGNNLMNNCLTQVASFTKIKYDYTTGQILNRCVNCQTCFSTHYLNTQHLPFRCVFIECLSIFPKNEGAYDCVYCSKSKNFVLVSGQCICQQGYSLNQFDRLCESVCGDGLTIDEQCDDGNYNDQDGCSNDCKLMERFVCNVTVNQVYCKYEALSLEIKRIIKNDKNSAILVIHAKNAFFPFPFESNHFQVNNSLIELTMSEQPFATIVLESQVIYSLQKQIRVLFRYSISIQGLSATLTINTAKTKYICYNDQVKLDFLMKADNGVFIIKNNTKIYGSLQTQALISTILTNLLFVLSLFSQKFIGLECILTLQLIYYSQLLVFPIQNWPIGFETLSYLRYSNGYNQIFQKTDDQVSSTIQKKLSFLGMEKFVFENYFVSFMMLLLSFLFFLVVLLVIQYTNKKTARQNQSNKLKLKQLAINKINISERQNYQKQQKFLLKIIEFGYGAILQISKWSILQVICALSAFITISDNNQLLQNLSFVQQILLKNQKLIISISLLIICLICLNNFGNLLLNDLSYGKLKERNEQMQYKKFIFVYLIFMGMLIFFGNQRTATSLIAFFVHLFYTYFINYKVRPYQKSLKIHRFTLFLNHFVYLLFLLLINAINYLPAINELILLASIFFIKILTNSSLLISVIRLYYEYRYGQSLQQKVQKDKETEKVNERQKLQEKLKKKLQLIKIRAKKKIQTQKQLKMQDNRYLFSNYQIQQQKQDLLDWLQKRNNLTKEDKQTYYFQKFKQKPLEWLKKNRPSEFNEKLKRIQKQKQKQITIQQKSQLHKIKQRITKNLTKNISNRK